MSHNLSWAARCKAESSISVIVSLSLSLYPVLRLNISDSDMLTIKDGDDETTSVLGRYVGGSSPFKLSSTTPCLTITFHSDPAGLVFGKGEGFIINYMGKSSDPVSSDFRKGNDGGTVEQWTVLLPYS